MRLDNILWGLYIILFPFYFFSKGNPQIADGFGALLFLTRINVMINILINKVRRENYLKLLFFFIIYTFLINILWSMVLGNVPTILASVYYTYCFMFLLFLRTKKNDIIFWTNTYRFLIISMLIQLMIYILSFSSSESIRTSLFFNNPNQLALWGICLLIIMYILTKILKVSYNQRILVFLLCSFFIVLSNSMAGISSIIFFWTFFLLNNKLKSSKYLIVLFAIFLLPYYYDFLNFDNFYLFEKVETRLRTDRQDDNTFHGRDYDRISNNYQYTFFGAGEGKTERFESIYLGELHSTYPSILFSYGIIGFLIFCYSSYIILRQRDREVLGLFMVLLIFSFAHMTLRIPFFWMSLYILFLFNQLKSKNHVRN